MVAVLSAVLYGALREPGMRRRELFSSCPSRVARTFTGQTDAFAKSYDLGDPQEE